MNHRHEAEVLIQALHGARIGGNLKGLCALFADHGRFEIAGTSADKPIAIAADGLAEFRPWLATLVKVFRLRNYRMESLVVEWPRCVAHWSVDIDSKVTGTTVHTDLVDLVTVRDGRIVEYTEFFVPR